jgi:hypothetical protein
LPAGSSTLNADYNILLGVNTNQQVRGRIEASTDIVEWIEENFYIASGGKAVLPPHQKCLLRLMFTRGDNGRFPYTTIVWSTIKKSGKSATAAMVARWFAETQARYGEIYAIGNDAKQARDRSFAEVRRSLELTPGYLPGRRVLPGRWQVLEGSFKCMSTGSKIEALSLDARGEAGSAPALTIWTELWGFESTEAIRFWEELTPVPTLPDSIRYVETYAGYEGESLLLQTLYDRGLQGHQLTAHDLALAGASNRPGESYEELLSAFEETGGDPDEKVPVYVDDASGLCMYWDEGTAARRMPWQRGVLGDAYYTSQAATLTPRAYERLHENRWVGAESSFIPIELYDKCHDPSLGPLTFTTPIVVACDAAVSGDCFGIVAVSRHPVLGDNPALRAAKVWIPPPGGAIDFDEPEAFLRWLMVGGCALGHPPPVPERGGMSTPTVDAMRAGCPACQNGDRVPPHNVVHLCYDPFQLENMMQRFNREGLTWVKKFLQGNDRLVADRQLYSVIVSQRLTWNFSRPEDAVAMRSHIRNANAKLQRDDDSKMRLKKKSEKLKIDLAVAASMGISRCMNIIMS